MCNPQKLEFQRSSRRRVEAAFDAGRVSSDGGLLLLREASNRLSLFKRFGDCFQDHRQGHRVEHTVPELHAQRVLAIACGYEDLNDHDRLRDGALLALAVGKSDPLAAESGLPTARAHTQCGQTNSGSGSHRWPTFSCTLSAESA